MMTRRNIPEHSNLEQKWYFISRTEHRKVAVMGSAGFVIAAWCVVCVVCDPNGVSASARNLAVY